MFLVIDQLQKKFDEKVIFDGANARFEKGKIYGLIGRNGSGKTTLFNCIAGNLRLDGGEIFLEEEGQKKKLVATDVAFTQTIPQLPPFMTAYEFIDFFLDIHADQLERTASPDEWLRLAGIDEKDQHRLMRDFSHGMKNKVQLLLTLIVQPPVILLDEPLTSFDPVAAYEYKRFIREMKSRSVIIFSTHILELAQEVCDDIVFLHHHTLQELPRETLQDPGFEEEVIAILSQEEAHDEKQS